MENIIYMLDHYDKVLMLYLNFDGGVIIDNIWKLFSLPIIWLPLAIMFLFGLIRHHVPFVTILLVIVFFALAVGLSDFISSGIIKPFCARLRPSHCITICNKLHYVDGYRGGEFGFVSSHAATTFSIFTFISLLLHKKRITYPLLFLTICICYSRIYLGVHYPGDILCGAIVGISMGGTSYLGLIYVYRVSNILPYYLLVRRVEKELYYTIWITLFAPIIIGIGNSY